MCERKFVLCVDGVLVNDGKILLLKRNVEPFKGYWHVAGGHVDNKENFKDALKREYKEETNLEIEVGDIIDFRIENTPDRTKIILVRRDIDRAHGQIRINSENSEIGWFTETPPCSVINYDSYIEDNQKKSHSIGQKH